MMGKFIDGVKSFVSAFANARSATAENYIDATRLNDDEARAIYRGGLGNKIVRLKAGYALDDTLQFDSTADEKFYRVRLAALVRQCVKWQLAFGRGLVVLHTRNDDLSKPLKTAEIDPATILVRVFSGDMVTVNTASIDLMDPRYQMPEMYNVRGSQVHWTRTVDFRYVIPPEINAPQYRYGGISEFELIYEQLIADGIVQRTTPRILEKASTMFYKVKGFKDAMSTGAEADMVNYFSRMEGLRGIMAAGIIDADDEVEAVTQSITNLADADTITLRRLAMVTGIPLTELVGEPAKGMNATGENEKFILQNMIESLQTDYLDDPINQLMSKLGKGPTTFKENQGETPTTRAAFDATVLANALLLFNLGEDYGRYLIDNGVTKPDDFGAMFSELDDDET
jgi:hypothetical protein